MRARVVGRGRGDDEGRPVRDRGQRLPDLLGHPGGRGAHRPAHADPDSIGRRRPAGRSGADDLGREDPGMSGALGGLLIGFIERPHSPEHRGSVTYGLISLLRKRGARVELAHAENNLYHLDTDPPWDLVVLKSGSAAALHLAAAAEAWGIPSVNRSESTQIGRAHV